jgi:hypothetical protein
MHGAMKVTDGFSTLLLRIEPSDRDIELYERHGSGP